jgi:hypothetical protein
MKTAKRANLCVRIVSKNDHPPFFKRFVSTLWPITAPSAAKGVQNASACLIDSPVYAGFISPVADARFDRPKLPQLEVST